MFLLHVNQDIFSFDSDKGSGLFPIHHQNKGLCQNNVLHAWNKIAHRVGTLVVFLMMTQ